MSLEGRANILREKKICRFCMDETGPLTNIYEKDNKSVPLPLQIMACVAIEVFASDGMPQLICNNCRVQTVKSYNFKTMCKKSDDALKLFLATGNLIKPILRTSSSTFTIKISGESQKREPSPDVETVEVVKRQKIEEEQTGSKISGSPEVVTLNYTAKISADSIASSVSSKISEDGSDKDEADDNSDSESLKNINPILKVNQIPTDVFPCTECQRSFPLKQLLDLHMVNHNRERVYKCDVCTRKFFTKYDLAKHQQTHSSNKPFTCIACNKQFSRETLLHRHEKIHTDIPKYLCTVCDKTYLTKDDLDAHFETHKKKRPYTCNICDKGFVFKQGLQRHIASHSEDKPHKCNYCEASFSSAIKLMRHITSHAGLRPYPCKVCARTFLLSHHLTRHMRSHYSSKSHPIGQHKCDVCSMSFRRKDSLINHSAIHSMCNLRCVICNTSFENATEVKDHITTHLAGLPFPCDKCDYSFETQEQLEAHEIKHAEMEYEDQIEREVNLESAGRKASDEEDDEDDYDDEAMDDEDYDPIGVDMPTIRRSKRASKIKNYAQFLKDELGSDIEDELVEPENEDDEDSMSNDAIKPIVRSEGTKVYARKQSTEKIIKPEPEVPKIILNDVAHDSTTLDQISFPPQIVNSLPNKQFVDMKIGQKLVRVQKLMMTKAEIEAMAKEGKIEMKGETILLKNTQFKMLTTPKAKRILTKPQPQIPNITIENIIDDPKPSTSQRMAVKKTYMKRNPMNTITLPADLMFAKEDENDSTATQEEDMVLGM